MIDAETTLKLIKEVAAEQPEHFVAYCSYATYKTDEDNVESATPNCIVGVVFNRLGVDAETLTVLDEELSSLNTGTYDQKAETIQRVTDLDFDTAAVELLAVAQYVQDNGSEYGGYRYPLDERDQEISKGFDFDTDITGLAQQNEMNLRRKWKYAAKAAEEVFLAH